MYTEAKNFEQGALRLTNQQLLDVAKKFNIKPNVLYSVIVNETGGRKAFDNLNRPIILFEGHIFYKLLKAKGFDVEKLDDSDKDVNNILYEKWADRDDAYKLVQYDRLESAILIDKDSALQSASYGIGQIMGMNYKICGYDNVEDFVKDMYHSEAKQLEIMLKFITANKTMYAALQKEDFATFAKLYNGPGYAQNKYDVKLKATADKFRTATVFIK